MDPEEGLGWDAEHTDAVELRYRRFLCMLYLDRNASIVPSKQIDAFWHQHILDTRAYAADCERVFGEFIHHFPYFGMRGEADAENLKRCFEETQRWYDELFHERYTLDQGSCRKCGVKEPACHHPGPGKCGRSVCEHPPKCG
jgi:hypothetical protein